MKKIIKAAIILTTFCVTLFFIAGISLYKEYKPFIAQAKSFEFKHNENSTLITNNKFDIEFVINNNCWLDSTYGNYLVRPYYFGEIVCKNRENTISVVVYGLEEPFPMQEMEQLIHSEIIEDKRIYLVNDSVSVIDKNGEALLTLDPSYNIPLDEMKDIISSIKEL